MNSSGSAPFRKFSMISCEITSLIVFVLNDTLSCDIFTICLIRYKCNEKRLLNQITLINNFSDIGVMSFVVGLLFVSKNCMLITPSKRPFTDVPSSVKR